MNKIILFFTTCLLLLSQPAYSIDLQTAKSQGLIGETPTGYLAAVKTPGNDVHELISTINAKRKAKYKEISARNKTTLTAVEELAGKKAIDKSKPGSYIKQNGNWIKK